MITKQSQKKSKDAISFMQFKYLKSNLKYIYIYVYVKNNIYNVGELDTSYWQLSEGEEIRADYYFLLYVISFLE